MKQIKIKIKSTNAFYRYLQQRLLNEIQKSHIYSSVPYRKDIEGSF